MCHVLIIEDEPFIAMDIQGVLQVAGATSFEFADCEEDAIAAARERQPDLITSDVKLRVGMGPAAVAAIRAVHGDIPVIFITASPDQCEGCPQEYVLTKPMIEPALTQIFLELAPL